MTLTTATQLTSRARCVRRASLGAVGSLPFAATAPQQVRNFRFGRLWSSDFDSEASRGSCRQHRHFRRRYTETLNRRLSWDQKPLAAGDVKSGVRSYWNSNGPKTSNGAKYADLDAPLKSPDNPDGIRPGQNIEDVERAPLEDLLFGHSAHWSNNEKPAPQELRKSKKSRSPRSRQNQDIILEAKAEFIIDPITNRKVPVGPKSRAYSTPDLGVDIPIRSFKSYRSQPTPFAAPNTQDAQVPIFYDGPPPEAELKKYSQITLDDKPWDSTSTKPTQPSSTAAPSADSPSDILGTIAWKHQEVSWHHSDGIAPSSKAWSLTPDTSECKDLPQYNVAPDEVTSSANQKPGQDHEDLGNYSPVIFQEPGGNESEQMSSEEYGDLAKYGPLRSHEPDGKYSAESESAVEKYKDLGKYEAVRSHEPDGKYKVQYRHAQEYEDLPEYRAVRSHEPDGKYKAEQGASVQQYDDLDNYGAVRAHEPDGKYKPEQQAADPEYEDLVKYGAIRAAEPDGMYKAEQEAAVQQYEDLDKYGAVRAHEPDGKYKVEQESAAPQYDDLDKYGPVRVHEPDGKYKLREETAGPQYDDLHKYGAVRAHEPDGKYKAQAEAASAIAEVDPEELSKYAAFRSHEPDGMYAATYVKAIPDLEELAQYKPFRSHEPDGKYAASYAKDIEDRTETGRYQAFRSHEPDGMYASGQQLDPKVGYTDLETYGAFRSHEPDGKYARERTQPTVLPGELNLYEAVRSSEPDGKYAAQSESSTEVPDLGNHEAFGYEDSETQAQTAGIEHVADPTEHQTLRCDEMDGQSAPQSRKENHDSANLGNSCFGDTSTEQAFGGLEAVADETVEEQEPDSPVVGTTVTEQAAAYLKPEKSNYRKIQELLMSESAAEDSLELGTESSDAITKTTATAKALTGSYVRDFPEEFVKTWSSRSSDPGSPLLPTDLGISPHQLLDPEEGTGSSFTKPSNALESALERHQKPRASPVTGDVESSEAESLLSRVSSTAATELMLYKILVYDPTMQSIEVAETTSMIPDSATPLTPADVLLRLSNPAKFFPHFAPLQAQGYEIVSGSGDVLIFRKVRDAAPCTRDQADSSPIAEKPVTEAVVSTPHRAQPVNPIDMTGGDVGDYNVAAGRFASPTGFVNYNLPASPAEPISPPPLRQYFSAHLDDSYSPPRTKSESEGKKTSGNETKSLPKRLLVGAVWVGGLSYSMAVVSNYFKTGGLDGKGPKGRL